MDLNNLLQKQKKHSPVIPRQDQIQKTIALSQERFLQQEQTIPMRYQEFLWTQFQVTRKRWWVLQAALLALSSLVIPCLDQGIYRMRSAGVIGCLFVVFMIPELWRNRENESTQIEAACFYSLRQVYAARITLFALVDVVLLTLFSFQLRKIGFTPMEVMSQFLLPATVTACICFTLLCGKPQWGEAMSLAVCLTWCGIWWLVLMNEYIYAKIIPSVWLLLLGLALGFLATAVSRTIRTTNQYWEVNYS